MGSTGSIISATFGAIADGVKGATHDFSSSDIGRGVEAVSTLGTSEAIRAGQRAKAGMETPAKDAKAAAEAQQRQASQLASDAELQRTNQEGTTAATAAADAARTRQLALAASAQGRRSTILTGPLGSVGDATTTRKTILGA